MIGAAAATLLWLQRQTAGEGQMVEITQKEFRQLADFIKLNYGIHLKDEKRTLLTGRLQTVLQQDGFANFTEYYNHVVSDHSGDAVVKLVDKITTNHTFFMREADHFHFFRDHVLPQMAARIKDNDLRIWCAACSSGEESYTLAMLLDEFSTREKLWWDHKVLATDISEKVLNIAKQGVYSSERIAPLPAQWRMNYFRKLDNEHSILTEKIRGEVIYRKFNLIQPSFPFRKRFHTIFCRNVMIYFDSDTKVALVNRFYEHMEPGGYLFIGHSESLCREMTKFRYVMPSVYLKE